MSAAALAAAATAAPARLAALETEEFNRLRREGFTALYNMDYASARSRFEALARLAPRHPAGQLYQATTLWLEILNRQRRLRSNLFSGNSFFAETEEKLDRTTDSRLRALAGGAIARCQEALAAHPDDVEALYFQGHANGLIASYEATVVRSFFPALRNGLAAVKLHERVLELDPGFVDARLTTGTYNYIMGSLPLFVKILAALGGYRGSREKGLEAIRSVAANGRWADDDARVALLTFYSRERRWADALQVAHELSRKYPRNYVFRLECAGLQVTLGRDADSRQIFESILADPSMASVADLVHYQYAESLVLQKRTVEALRHFEAAASTPGASSEIAARGWLRAGQMLDLLDRRDEAVQRYRRVLGMANAYDSHEQARNGIKKPYTDKD
jgi:tetratricopeptide (TPR) repeat protein